MQLFPSISRQVQVPIMLLRYSKILVG